MHYRFYNRPPVVYTQPALLLPHVAHVTLVRDSLVPFA